jgi:hypothetical protein
LHCAKGARLVFSIAIPSGSVAAASVSTEIENVRDASLSPRSAPQSGQGEARSLHIAIRGAQDAGASVRIANHRRQDAFLSATYAVLSLSIAQPVRSAAVRSV